MRRKERLAKLLKEEISQILRDEVRDPRIGMVVVTRVDLSEDMKKAKVYFTTIPEGREKEVEDALRSAKNYIKAVLIKRLRVKFVPELSFKLDIELKNLERIWEKL